jgi:hypothetical protein
MGFEHTACGHEVIAGPAQCAGIRGTVALMTEVGRPRGTGTSLQALNDQPLLRRRTHRPPASTAQHASRRASQNQSLSIVAGSELKLCSARIARFN